VVWPYEAALDEAALTASAELACAELLLGGTTAILDMGTVHHTDAVFAAAERSGIRATIGKAMMDAPDPHIPPGLRESTQASLDQAEALIARWHGAAAGRLRYAYAPRFVLSCTDELLREVADEARQRGLRIHTHASESTGEIALVRQRFGKDNIAVLDDFGLLGDHCCVAHCVHVSDDERRLLAARGAHVCHCPSSNLKLASESARSPSWSPPASPSRSAPTVRRATTTSTACSSSGSPRCSTSTAPARAPCPPPTWSGWRPSVARLPSAWPTGSARSRSVSAAT